MIELFINNNRVEFITPPEILYTYQKEEILDLTLIKNEFTKTLEINRTPNNRKIFKHIENNLTNNYTMQPLKYELFCNGEVVERGYIKLDEIDEEKYYITLYGSLGDFVYNLQNIDGRAMTLKDLGYSFKIQYNAKTMLSAWDNIESKKATNIYNAINFVPCFNSFKTNKILVKKGNDSRLVYGESGYAVGELNEEINEWQAHNLLSYKQVPCIKFRDIFDRCCNPKYNGGYEVVLDKSFFNDDNVYYNKTWLTLKQLDDLTIDVDYTQDGNNLIFNNIENGVTNNLTIRYDLNFAPYDNKRPHEVFTSYKTYDKYYYKSINLQFFIKDKNGDTKYSTKKIMHYTNLSDAYPFEENKFTVIQNNGKFIDNLWNGKTQSITIKNIQWEEGMYGTYEISFSEVSNFDHNRYITTETDFFFFTNSNTKVFGDVFMETMPMKSRGYTAITEDNLLSDTKTPSDYFLSFCKIFKLYLYKEPFSNRIHILTKQNYYQDKVIDLTDIVSNEEVNITPLTFENKYYSFQFPLVEHEKNYTDYGKMLVNTNYPFNNKVYELFDDSAFVTTSMVTFKDRYNNKNNIKPYEICGAEFNNDINISPTVIYKYNLTDYPLLPIFDDETQDCLLFYNGNQNVNNYTMVDKNTEYEDEDYFIYGEGEKLDRIPYFSRWYMNDNEVVKSLDFGTPKTIYTDVIINDSSNIYTQYWGNLIRDIYDSNTRTISLYLRINSNNTKVIDMMRYFYYYDGCLWQINKIEDYNHHDNELTKVTLVKVNNKYNYLT